MRFPKGRHVDSIICGRTHISPCDLSRSMRLNPNDGTVRAIYAFIGQSVEQVRREIVDRERQRRQSEEATQLIRCS